MKLRNHTDCMNVSALWNGNLNGTNSGIGIQKSLESWHLVVTVLVLGVFVGVISKIFNLIRKHIYGDKENLDISFDAGGRVSSGLTATTIVSQWTWTATLLKSSAVASKYGISGPFWYAAGATIQIFMFSMITVQLKTRAPGAKTFLQVIKARFGGRTHIVFCIFALITNIIVTAMLMLGGAVVLTTLVKEISVPFAVTMMTSVICINTFIGGLGATFYISYFNNVVTFVVMLLFMSRVYNNPDPHPDNPLGSIASLHRLLSCKIGPPENLDNSYLTMVSSKGFMFGIINIIGNFGAVFVDQSFWQSGVAAKPKQGVWGFLIGGLVWFAIPFVFATTMGLSYIAMETHAGESLLCADQVNEGLVPVIVAQRLFGKLGEFLIIVIIIFAVISTGSAEVIAVASILVYDIYQIHLKESVRITLLFGNSSEYQATRSQTQFYRGVDSIKRQDKTLGYEDGHNHRDNTSSADTLYKTVRVLCWVMTSPKNLKTKAQHVRATWAKRCNIIIFISSETNKDFPTVGINTTEGRDHLTAKTMNAFKYCWDNYKDQADWFLKADDDTFVIVENLRYLLLSYKRTDPIYFGHKFKANVKQGYMSGGGGYVLSHEALRRLAEKGLQDPEHCRKDGGAEDVEMGKCMEYLGVAVGDSRDAMGRSRFHCFDISAHLEGRYPDWYHKYDANGATYGPGNISDYSISFHYVKPRMMYHLDFFTYHLRPYDSVVVSAEPHRLVTDANSCILCGKAKGRMSRLNRDKCRCQSMTYCIDCHRDDILRMECRRAVKPGFRCSVHGDFRAYYAYLASLKNWCIVWCCVAILPITYGLSALKVSLSWVYLFMGILIGPAVVPVSLCMFWARLTGKAMVAGTMGGVTIGLTVWLSVAASHKGGLGPNYFFENTGSESSMLWGNLSAIASGGLITWICSLLNHSVIDTTEIWENTRDIDNPLSPWPEMYARELGISGAHLLDRRPSLSEIKKVFKSAKLIAIFGATFLTVCLLVIWPLSAMSSGVMNLSEFIIWINISKICGYLAGVVIIILPLVDEAISIWTAVRRKTMALNDVNILGGNLNEPAKPPVHRGKKKERKESPNICVLCFKDIDEMKKDKRFPSHTNDRNTDNVFGTSSQGDPTTDDPLSFARSDHLPEFLTIADTLDLSPINDTHSCSRRFAPSFGELARGLDNPVESTLNETMFSVNDTRLSLSSSYSSISNPRDPIF
ncbi:unnamed protein product [Owenia fusiformis]|uniref:Glycoprotein-N-acetylgalactosamine 3-beta-galactosyltransferase 1 n=1 Tax=Owenia fusiformis TaxID=6347 RepID=A0A8S4N075_OWEFU|nr:unnamed protein product [Owenia fusiformis]